MPRPKKDNPLTRVTVSVDPGDYRQMEELARQNGHSTASFIRQSMKDFLKKHRATGSVKRELKENR